MRIIAVSQRVEVLPERGESRDALDQRLTGFVHAAGGLSVPVPNALDAGIGDWLSGVRPHAIVLSGGDDIGKCAARDATECALLDHAIANRLPVLGICRGMQMMAHWAGTPLQPAHCHVATRHPIEGEIVGDVNSYHGYSLARCPDGYRVLAQSRDGQIEAIRHLDLPWEGWMWHPEREQRFASRDVERLKMLIE